LVGNIEHYYIEIGGNSIAEKNIAPKPRAKLFIIDDMEINLRTHLEMWKKLLSSQRVNLRDAYLNMEFEGGMPVIVTMNNSDRFAQLANSSLFEAQCYFLPLQNYMGPLGSKPMSLLRSREINNQKYHFSEEQEQELGAPRQKKKKTHFIAVDESSNSNSIAEVPDHFNVSHAQFRLMIDVLAYWDSLKKPNLVVNNHNNNHYHNELLSTFSEKFMTEYIKITQQAKSSQSNQNSDQKGSEKQDWLAEAHQQEVAEADRMHMQEEEIKEVMDKDKRSVKPHRIIDLSSNSSTRPSTAAKLTTERHLDELEMEEANRMQQQKSKHLNKNTCSGEEHQYIEDENKRDTTNALMRTKNIRPQKPKIQTLMDEGQLNSNLSITENLLMSKGEKTPLVPQLSLLKPSTNLRNATVINGRLQLDGNDQEFHANQEIVSNELRLEIVNSKKPEGFAKNFQIVGLDLDLSN
jgi:hypothetical protein